MKATLLPRENVRLAWFKAEGINFQCDRKVELSYYQSSLQQDAISRRGLFQIVFQDVPKQVPESQIIIFDKNLGGLPESYNKTTGSVGSRLSTDWADDLEVEITDRLVSYKEGKEAIRHEPPPPNMRSRLKEIEIRERDDLATRKITVKNLTARGIDGYKIKLFENKDIRFDDSPVEVFKIDPPEYTWSIDVPADSTSSIEFTLKIHTVKTFEIEKEITHIIPRVSMGRDNAQVEQDFSEESMNKDEEK